MRRDSKQVERLLWGLRLAVGIDFDRATKEFRNRSAQVESTLLARLEDIDASLNVIARELARRTDDSPSGEASG